MRSIIVDVLILALILLVLRFTACNEKPEEPPKPGIIFSQANCERMPWLSGDGQAYLCLDQARAGCYVMISDHGAAMSCLRRHQESKPIVTPTPTPIPRPTFTSIYDRYPALRENEDDAE